MKLQANCNVCGKFRVDFPATKIVSTYQARINSTIFMWFNPIKMTCLSVFCKIKMGTLRFQSTTEYHTISTIIGGHGFWGKGGVYTGGVSKKIFRLPSAIKKFLRRLWHSGVILLNKNEKKAPTQVSICPNFFSPWGYQGGCVCLWQGGVSGDFWF